MITPLSPCSSFASYFPSFYHSLLHFHNLPLPRPVVPLLSPPASPILDWAPSTSFFFSLPDRSSRFLWSTWSPTTYFASCHSRLRGYPWASCHFEDMLDVVKYSVC